MFTVSQHLFFLGYVTLNSEDIRGLVQVPKFRCFELEALPGMEILVSLKGLWEHGCVKLKCIRGLV